MPYSSNPQFSTYKTERVPLVKDVFLRSTDTYDAIYENCIVEMLKNKETKQLEMAAVKRPGTTTLLENIVGEFRGCFYWQKKNTFIYVIGNTFYFWDISTAIGTATSSATLTTTTGPVGFEEFLYASGAVSVVWSDGTKLGEITDTFTVNVSADADLPSPHVPNPVFLDGYIFIIKSGTQDIYNSDVDAPLSWTAGDFVSAEMSADTLSRIERMSNYVIALGTQSIEYFYDAANAAGSPLSRNDTFYKQVGYLGAAAKLGNKIYIIGRERGDSPDIYIIEDSKATPVGNQQIRRFLSRVTDFSTTSGSFVSFDSNTNYVFTVGGKTFAYNIDSEFFTIWKHKQLSVFNIKHADITYKDALGYNTYMYLADDNKLVKFDLTSYQDSGVNYTFKVRTEPIDFDTLQFKFMSRLSLYVDNSNTTATITVQWSDNDYSTFNTGQTVSLQQELPSARRLGGFRKRAFVFTNTENQPIRFRGFEVDLNMGVS